MKKILNFFRSKNKKNILLSLFLAFSIFLSVGVAALPTKKASAAISGNIYDYAWANYFDFHEVHVSSDPENSFLSFDINLTSRTIRATIVDLSDYYGHMSFYIDTLSTTFDQSLSVLPDLQTYSLYAFSADCFTSFPNYSVDVSLQIGYVNPDTGIFVNPFYDSRSSGYDDYTPPNYELDPNYAPYYYRIWVDISLDLSALPEISDYIILSNIGVYAGQYPYTYSNYFYDLTSIPNPVPTPIYPGGGSGGDSSSDDSSSSEDSGSDDDSSGGIIPPPEMEGDYLDGYLAGLEYGKYGVFSQCQCYIQLNYQYEYERIQITDDFFIYGGLDLSKFLPLVENKENVLSSYIYFYFPTGSYPVSSELSFSATGITDAFIGNPWSVTFQNTPNSKQLSWSLVSSETLTTDRNIYKSDTLSQSFTGSDVILSFKTPTFPTFDYLSGLTITVSNNLYELGYSAGLTVNGQDRYDAGYTAGYLKGDNDGYIRGFNKGTGNDPFSIGDFMFTAMDMPGRIVYNWLNFDFLGVNLAGLLATLITIGLVGVIFAKLKIF